MFAAGLGVSTNSTAHAFMIVISRNAVIKAKLPVLAAIILLAQVTKTNAQSKYQVFDTSYGLQKNLKQSFSFLKVNEPAFASMNYSIEYERVISRKISLSLSYRAMPGTTMPVKNLIINTAGQDDKNIAKTIANLKLRHFAITPEIRFYLGKKGFGNGFYIAPFIRYEGFKTDEWMVNFGEGKDRQNSLRLSGKLTTHTEGIMLGAQWNVGKRVCIDWWILGPHHGSGKGEFSGISDRELNAREQKNLAGELNNLDIPSGAKTVVVSSKGASLQLGGLWAGIRGGIAIGLRY